MIGEGWTDDSEARTRDTRPDPSRPRRVAIVTGTRAEFGLLTPVIRAAHDRSDLEPLVVVAGAHMVQPALGYREVKSKFEVADSIPMQTVGKVGRDHDVEALGKGIARFGRSFSRLAPEWVVVLGDRIEAFAAACAASIGGRALAHIHGGDRAEGVSDESMRHAITKLAHLHLPATETSAQRIIKMGEDGSRVRVIGSPGVDGLAHIDPMNDQDFEELGSPEIVVLVHPIGRPDEREELDTGEILSSVSDRRVLALHPNLDPGRHGIMRALMDAPENVKTIEHLPRDRFVALLKRVALSGGALIGNSSSGLIECAAIGCPSVDIGDRQRGRERCAGWTEHAPPRSVEIRAALDRVVNRTDRGDPHPFGDGTSGVLAARILATTDPHDAGLIRKLNAY